jgi:hypothetical protein
MRATHSVPRTSDERIAQEHAMDGQVPNAKRHDPFDDERWSFPWAVAWVIWRSREYVAQLLSDLTESEGQVQVFDIFNEASRRETGPGCPPKGGVLSFLEAQAELWEQLRQGRLVAMGVKVGETTWSHIPGSAWVNLDYFPCIDGRSNSIGSNHSKVYDEVTVRRSAMLEIWPDITKVKTGPKRGSKPKVSPDHLKSIVFELLCESGDIMDIDPEWRTQGDIEHKTREELLRQKFSTEKIPKKTQLRMYVSKFHREWRDKQQGQ